MAGYRDCEGNWHELPWISGTWHSVTGKNLFAGGPRNDHDILRCEALDEEGRAEASSKAHELFHRPGPDGESRSVAYCWRTALDEVYQARGVVMKRSRKRWYLTPQLVPAEPEAQACSMCGQPIAKTKV